MELTSALSKIFEILSTSGKIDTFGQEKIIDSSFLDLLDKLKHKLSPLPNQSPDLVLLNKLISELTTNHSIVRLNHVGFCYHVSSQLEGKNKLLKIKLPEGISLYEEPSNDAAKWYFFGNTTNWQQPLTELLPVESNGDTFIDYWLPHVHIDIDTTLDENQIESLLYKIYDGDPKPFRSTVIDDVVYTIRLRLGILDGVNIFIDISTNHRQVELHRTKILQKIS